MCNKNSKQIIASLNRIAGQVRGVGQMVEDERYCIDILNQIHAVKAALSKVENQVLRSHAACCVEDALDEVPVIDLRGRASVDGQTEGEVLWSSRRTATRAAGQ